MLNLDVHGFMNPSPCFEELSGLPEPWQEMYLKSEGSVYEDFSRLCI
jgi:hypothetical protein